MAMLKPFMWGSPPMRSSAGDGHSESAFPQACCTSPAGFDYVSISPVAQLRLDRIRACMVRQAAIARTGIMYANYSFSSWSELTTGGAQNQFARGPPKLTHTVLTDGPRQ